MNLAVYCSLWTAPILRCAGEFVASREEFERVNNAKGGKDAKESRKSRSASGIGGPWWQATGRNSVLIFHGNQALAELWNNNGLFNGGLVEIGKSLRHAAGQLF